jgi:alpha-1,2-mannosyltransferase
MTRPPPNLCKRFWLAGCGIGLFLLTLAVAGPFVDPSHKPGKVNLGYDFLPAYVAGYFARTGEFEKVYDPIAFSEMQTRVIAEADLDMDGRYGAGLNPPHLALMFAPLSALPYRTAAAVFLGMNVALLAGSLAMLARLLPAERRIRWLVPVLVMASMPFCQAMGHQQNTFLSLLLLSVAVTCWRSGLPFAAGVCAGLLFYKPQLALVVSVVLVADAGRRAALGLGVTGLVTLLVTLAYAPGALDAYVHKLPANLDGIQNQLPYNWGRQATFLGFWRLLLQGRQLGPALALTRILWTASALAVAAALVAAFLRARRTGQRDRIIAAAIAATPLLLPYFMDYDLLLLAVPAVLFANDVIRRGTMSRRDAWLLRAWVPLYLWAYLNPGLSGLLRVSLTVPLVAAVAAGLIARCFEIEREALPALEPVAPPRAMAA